MNVLSVGYPLAPVGENTAGGAEQVLSMLDEALVRAGHHSFVIAPEGSNCRGILLRLAKVPKRLDEDFQCFARQKVRAALRFALSRWPVDVIHLHGVDFFDYLPEPGPPVVITLHLPPAWYPSEVFRLTRPDTHLICVSNSQLRECPPGAQIHRVIDNGVHLDRYRPARTKGRYVVALGRICPEKGFHLALDAATHCGLPLILAGTVFGYAAHQEYFQAMIRPRLSGRHRFVGAVGRLRKRELLAGARCLVLPSLVSETSSLVAMEAMASGTPVVAFRRGALEEIIEHGRTGFLVDTPEELSDAIEASRDLSSSLCRERAEAAFSAEKMIREYLALYREVGKRSNLNHDPDLQPVAA